MFILCICNILNITGDNSRKPHSSTALNFHLGDIKVQKKHKSSTSAALVNSQCEADGSFTHTVKELRQRRLKRLSLWMRIPPYPPPVPPPPPAELNRLKKEHQRLYESESWSSSAQQRRRFSPVCSTVGKILNKMEEKALVSSIKDKDTHGVCQWPLSTQHTTVIRVNTLRHSDLQSIDSACSCPSLHTSWCHMMPLRQSVQRN